jgi:hypothetical protein
MAKTKAAAAHEGNTFYVGQQGHFKKVGMDTPPCLQYFGGDNGIDSQAGQERQRYHSNVPKKNCLSNAKEFKGPLEECVWRGGTGMF